MLRFSDKDWDRVRTNYRKWWKGELGRPILPMVIYGADPGREKPAAPLLSFANSTDLSIAPEQLIDRIDYELSCREFYGDSYPFVQMFHFGPGVMAAFLGAVPASTQNTVWFHPKSKLPIAELHLEYDPDNIWFRRIKDIYRAGTKKWGGDVCMSMTDLGSPLDILASFVTTEELLYCLYDEPKEVARLVGEISVLWKRFYDEINEIISGQQGFSDWATIFSEKPSYMLQCDFSYMIGPDMFDKFVLDELRNTAGKLDKPFYHLDGVGELPHLDSLMDTEEIRGIQWVPGDGEPLTRDWSELFSRISRGGKKIQIYYNFESYFDVVLDNIDRPDDLIKTEFGYPMREKENALRKLSRFCEIPVH